MIFYEPNDHRQQIEILRRFSAEVLNDREFQSYAPYKNTEEIEDALVLLFFSHRGISDIALYFGAPEFVIMEKLCLWDSINTTMNFHSSCIASKKRYI